ncbi:MAG TPA: 23S rRNA (adenine(2503)-C(2))-methyltransferase RlmN [Rhodobacteraceae bacterium]|nr:23S rRNA (adenine(2503)-C(2))-methyltransferase RlmN [Paracoccaceae bacterium]
MTNPPVRTPAIPREKRTTSATRPSLVGLDRAGLKDALSSIGVADKSLRMRANQLWNWLYVQGSDDFAAMTNINRDLRDELAKRHSIARPELVTEHISDDGTRKWLMRFRSGTETEPPVEVETVYIPDGNRGTLCVSSQVGCTLACTFCHTGTQKLVRNLTAGEIVSQILFARDRLGDWPNRETRPKNTGPGENNRLVSNIVMMGMGEPLYNFDSVKQALLIASDGEGLGLSKRRITLSTAGVVPMISRVGSEIGVMLAISLHAVRDDVRDRLVPLNRKYPIAELLDACRRYPGLSNARRITFEYVMLKDVNDSLGDAREFVKLIRGIPAKVNLIPFNPWPGSRLQCSDWDQIERFADVINRAGYAAPIRMPRGRDIFAACGQLKSETERMRARERLALAAMIGDEN